MCRPKFVPTELSYRALFETPIRIGIELFLFRNQLLTILVVEFVHKSSSNGFKKTAVTGQKTSYAHAGGLRCHAPLPILAL